MKLEEMREDIPMDVREALAELSDTYGGNPLREVVDKIENIVRAKPKTVRMPAADIPAPLTEVPESGGVWSIRPWAPEDAACSISLSLAPGAIANGLAWDTREKAEAALAAFTAREEAPRPIIPWRYAREGEA